MSAPATKTCRRCGRAYPREHFFTPVAGHRRTVCDACRAIPRGAGGRRLPPDATALCMSCGRDRPLGEFNRSANGRRRVCAQCAALPRRRGQLLPRAERAPLVAAIVAGDGPQPRRGVMDGGRELAAALVRRMLD